MQYQLKIQQLVPYAASAFCIDAIYSCSREWMLLSGMNLSYKIWSVERIADYLHKTLLQYTFLRCKMIFRKIVNMKQ